MPPRRITRPGSSSRGTRAAPGHWLIITLLAAGTVLRAFAWFAYQPALLYGDSFRYLDNVGDYDPAGLHPIGYSLFVLGPVLAVDGLELVAAIQHVAVLAAAVAIYAPCATGCAGGWPPWLPRRCCWTPTRSRSSR